MDNYRAGLTPHQARKAAVAKDKSKHDKRMPLAAAVTQLVKDSDNVAIGGFIHARPPQAIIHEIIRQGRENLTLTFQSAGLPIEYLAAAMALNQKHLSLKRIEFAYWGHEAFGTSPMFRYLAENGLIEIEEWSNYSISARLKAGSMGLPFIPAKSQLGSDLQKINRTIETTCPFTGDPISLLPASYPNVALIHVQEADIFGNCRLHGPLCTCPEMALAAERCIVTCEKLIEHEDMLLYPQLVSIPFFAVDAVAQVPFGAYPGNCSGLYYYDQEHLMQFRNLCEDYRQGKTEGLASYFHEFIFNVKNYGEFLAKIPSRQILHIQRVEPGVGLLSATPVVERG